MPWITNYKHKIEEKSTKSSQSSSKVVGLGPADLWEFPTLPIRPLGTHFSEIWIKIQNFSFVKMHLNMSSVKMVGEIQGEMS